LWIFLKPFFFLFCKMTAINPPAALLSALQAEFSSNATYTFFQCPTSVFVSPAILGKAGCVACYLVPPGGTLQIGSTMPAGVTVNSLPGAADSITYTTKQSTGTGFNAVNSALSVITGVETSKINIVSFSGVAHSSTSPSFTYAAGYAAMIMILPGAFIYQDTPEPAATSSTAWVLYIVAGVLVGVAGICLVVWLILRRRAQAAES